MKVYIFLLFTTLNFITNSCGYANKKLINVHSDWIRLSLQTGWTFYAPKNFAVKPGRGTDSYVGDIISIEDSIFLQYDSGTESFFKGRFTFQQCYERAKEEIEHGFYKDFYKLPILYTAYIDTIDHKIAVIVRPVKVGQGELKVYITQGSTGEWLALDGENLNAKQEKLVLEIFKTLKLDELENKVKEENQ